MNTILLQHLAVTTCLAAAVGLFCHLGRFRPALCHALWLVVLVKFLLPPIVNWPVEMDVVAMGQAWLDARAAPQAGP